MKKACLLLLLLPTSAFAQTWAQFGISVPTRIAVPDHKPVVVQSIEPTHQITIKDEEEFHQQQELEDNLPFCMEDRRAKWARQSYIRCPKKNYKKAELVIAEDRMPNPGLIKQPIVLPVDCPGDPNCPQIPDEATKKRALQRGFELNGNKMCCGSIDVSQDPVVTGRTVITPETEFNVLDATPVTPEKEQEKKKHK